LARLLQGTTTRPTRVASSIGIVTGPTDSLTRDARPVSGGVHTGAPCSSGTVAVPGRVARELRLTVARGAGEPLQLRVAGDLDVATAPELESQLMALGAIRLDLSRVTFIDLVGLRVLVEAHVRDRRLHVVAASSACEHLLELTRTTHLLRVD